MSDRTAPCNVWWVASGGRRQTGIDIHSVSTTPERKAPAVRVPVWGAVTTPEGHPRPPVARHGYPSRHFAILPTPCGPRERLPRHVFNLCVERGTSAGRKMAHATDSPRWLHA